jgi:hypothetical protein
MDGAEIRNPGILYLVFCDRRPKKIHMPATWHVDSLKRDAFPTNPRARGTGKGASRKPRH